jgi:hypothetical protein
VKKSFESLEVQQLDPHHRDWRIQDQVDQLAEALHGKWLHFVSSNQSAKAFSSR